MENVDILDLLEQDINKYAKSGQIILCGDLNARSGIINDFTNDDSLNYIPLPSNYSTQRPGSISKRQNLDKNVNEYGKWLANLCINHQLNIVNG